MCCYQYCVLLTGTIWRMRIACWIPKATNTNTEYVILIAFPLLQWLNERNSMSRYTYVTYLVVFWIGCKNILMKPLNNGKVLLPESSFRGNKK